MTTRSRLRVFLFAVCTLGIAIFMTNNNTRPTAAMEHPENPLLSNWIGPYGGIPPFDKVKVADFKPALEAAMAENLAEIDKIANNPTKPTFQNTIAALEKTGHTLDRVTTVYGIWVGSMSSPELQLAGLRLIGAAGMKSRMDATLKIEQGR